MDIFLQGFTMGLAYLAPIGAQNLFVINTALTAPLSTALATAGIVTFFDISLALACFWGIGLIIGSSLLLQKSILCGGGLILIYIGWQLLRAKVNTQTSATYAPTLWQTVSLGFTVTWFNPQAVIDGTLMLGAFRSSLPDGSATCFIGGVAIASMLWFFGLVGVFKTCCSKLQPVHMLWINRLCGLVILGYALKLLLVFWQM
ncbi:LysE family transporter [uncultured Phascolarctobacterium sp.]|uniref:LysE/ArgO family amino acid transporter n=1 Tax=Phascolarctobacterium sp. TaxID=2049039 RepID=UPI0025EED871|nr:LysE family transporter [uncultured Phascolarctobacterium sp.]